MSNNFFTSDCHFWHKNIIKYSNRPFDSVEEMNAGMIDNWNRVVGDNDTVYSLGDFAFCNIEKTIDILRQLKGTKFLIDGNHDNTIINQRRRILDDPECKVRQITSYKEIKINHQFICLFHYGQRVWNKSHYGSWLLYGHSHGNLPPFGKSVDVGVDSPYITGAPTYTPFSFQQISEFMLSRQIESGECHPPRKDNKA